MSEVAVRRDTIAARRAGGDVNDRAQRRRLIVAAAVRVIEEHGVDAGLGVIADRAGLPRPHVYRHFTGKADLDQEVARQASLMLSAWIRPSLTARGTPPDLINGIVGRVVRWAAEHPNLYRFRARLASAGAVGELGDALAAYLRAAGHDARPPAHVVAGVIGLVDGAVLWWLDHRDEIDPDGLAESLAAQVLLVLAETLRRAGRTVDPAAELTPVTSPSAPG